MGFGILFAFLFLLGILCYGIYMATSGFKAEKIHCHGLQAFSIDYRASGFSEKVLDQPFFYLGKGRQAYVFSSLDGEYVIKFLRDQKYRPSLWMRASVFFHHLSSSQKKVLEDQGERLSRALLSYRLASAELSSETELLRMQIGENGGESKKIQLVDGLSRKFLVDLGKTSYIVQRRGDNLSAVLLQCAHQKETGKIQKAIHGFFAAVGQRLEKKILVRDAHCTLQNTAVCRDRVIEIDVGSFYIDPECDFVNELRRSAMPLRKFIEKNMPEMLPFFEEEWLRAL
jgi:hypothetical protein